MRKYTYCGFLSILLLMGCASAPTESEVVITDSKGRASLKAAGHDIKAPQPEGGPRKKSFCARMSGMKKKLTSAKTANDPNSRINKSLRKWKC